MISPIWQASPRPDELVSSNSDDKESGRKKKKKKKSKKASKREKNGKGDGKEKSEKSSKRKREKSSKVKKLDVDDDSSSMLDTSDGEDAAVALKREAVPQAEIAVEKREEKVEGEKRVEAEKVGAKDGTSDDDDEEEGYYGPQPVRQMGGGADYYGQNLLPGEGNAMAAYVQDGKRIPRRGEIGLRSEEIEAFEGAGYVMSGSRNRRMEAVRIRKENQIYSVEERAALAQFNFAEKEQREQQRLIEFRRLVDKKLGEGEVKNADPFEKRGP